MGNASLQIAGTRFSAEKILPRLETVFQNVIDDSKPWKISFSASIGVSGGSFND